MTKKILVTGGAGYIGSVVVSKLIEKGYSVVVIDNLSKGKKELVHKSAEFIEMDLLDKKKLSEVFEKNSFDFVMHFAAAKDVGESMVNPEPYTNNIICFCNLLSCMDSVGCKKIIYSSSAAVYGNPTSYVITEEHLLNPVNYYGFSKLECEKILYWYIRLKKFIGISLRYFNVAGDEIGYLDPDAKNIFPVIGEVISGEKQKLQIFGNNYQTTDGTCIRDYIHVSDLARAHILALESKESCTLNLGSEKGYSVLELVKEFEKCSGKKIPFEFVERREGDPEKLICSNKKAEKIINWKPELGLKEMVESTIKTYMKDK